MKGRWVTGVCGIRLKIDGKGLWHGIYKFRSVAQSCPTLCDPMDCSTTGLPVYHQLPEFTQTPVLLPGKSHGRRSLVGCSPWGHEELDTTRRLHFHFSLSCIREGNGNPLQCSCLENPRDGGAWWAAAYGVAQSRANWSDLAPAAACPLSRWCHPTISSSVAHFASHLQSFPASGSFQMSQFFASGGQSIGVLASASALPMNIQYWSPLGWTGWISLWSKGLSRILSNTTVQKHQFFSAQLSL